MDGILFKILSFQFKLFENNGTKFGAPGNRTPLYKFFKTASPQILVSASPDKSLVLVF